MTKDEAIALFGSAQLLADALGVTVQAVSQWGDDVPGLRVYQIRVILAERAKGVSDCAQNGSDRAKEQGE